MVEPITDLSGQAAPTPGQEATPQEAPAEDLLSRVSKFVASEVPKEDPKLEGISEHFDIKEIDAITDPVAKEQALQAYKSFQRGFGEKFQELSQLKKEMETLKSQPLHTVSQEWTPERVQALANDPAFIAAASKVTGDVSTDDDSVMSDAEKARMTALQKEVENLKQVSNQALQQQQVALRRSQHDALHTKYANYDPKEIDTITSEMIEGKIQATPEHIYKAFKHDDNVRKAYELGKIDERNGVSAKIASTSPEGIQTTHSSPTIVPEKDESSKSFFNRIIQKRLSEAAGRS
jgi:hypothetical protein